LATDPKTLKNYYGKAPSSVYARLADPKDTESTKAIVDALYASLSGPAGVKRDWDRFRSLHTDSSKSIRTGKLPEGTVACSWMTNDEYIEQMNPWFESNGFYELEVHRVEERFGNIVHVFSTYESKHGLNEKPYMRGINSIQLLYDGKRWWVMNVMWQHESDEFPLPAKYLP